ncbi:alpha/beta-Hydrolases superfamily protein [Trifolium repens]|nr:alpha/beta-Hydrolases superfamily protein [Trifolium repens]
MLGPNISLSTAIASLKKICTRSLEELSLLVCSVPPSGNSGLVWRYLISKPIAAFKVTYSLALHLSEVS